VKGKVGDPFLSRIAQGEKNDVQEKASISVTEKKIGALQSRKFRKKEKKGVSH